MEVPEHDAVELLDTNAGLATLIDKIADDNYSMWLTRVHVI